MMRNRSASLTESNGRSIELDFINILISYAGKFLHSIAGDYNVSFEFN